MNSELELELDTELELELDPTFDSAPETVADDMSKWTWSVSAHNALGMSVEFTVQVYAYTKEQSRDRVIRLMLQEGLKGDGDDFFVQHLIPTMKYVY